MLNINLTSRSSSIVIGLLVFFVPFFTYLTPENLKELSRFDVLEIFLSLIVLLIIIFIISFSVEMLIKRFFKKKNILFPLLCFAFYLNFFYTPFLEFLQEFTFLKFGYIPSIGIPVFIFFEICCLAIIAFGAKFNVFSTRMILIFSSLMLINAFIPLVGYLADNIEKKPTISYETNSIPLTQDAVLIKRNVYFIIMDAMVAIETLEPFNIATKEQVIDKLSNTGLRYIDKSISSYDNTHFTRASMMLLDYHANPSTLKFSQKPKLIFNSTLNLTKVSMRDNMQKELPIFSYLRKANSSFWVVGKEFDCTRPMSWTCVNSYTENLLNFSIAVNLRNFSLPTPLPNITKRIFGDIPTQDTIGPFLEYIDKNGIPKTPFFAYIHNYIPHGPFLVTSECEPTNYFNQKVEGYKASYQCALKTIQAVMKKINNIDPEAIVVFQGDHGLRHDSNIEETDINLELTEKEKHLFAGSIFNAIKAPEICFEKYGLPKTTVNTMRFALNCAYGFKLPYRKNIHYETNIDLGIVVERKLYE